MLLLLSRCRGLDLAVLPGGHEPTVEFVEWAVEVLGLDPGQVLYTPGQSYIMDEDMGESHVSHGMLVVCWIWISLYLPSMLYLLDVIVS